MIINRCFIKAYSDCIKCASESAVSTKCVSTKYKNSIIAFKKTQLNEGSLNELLHYEPEKAHFTLNLHQEITKLKSLFDLDSDWSQTKAN